jgi:hypothetical protein
MCSFSIQESWSAPLGLVRVAPTDRERSRGVAPIPAGYAAALTARLPPLTPFHLATFARSKALSMGLLA